MNDTYRYNLRARKTIIMDLIKKNMIYNVVVSEVEATNAHSHFTLYANVTLFEEGQHNNRKERLISDMNT